MTSLQQEHEWLVEHHAEVERYAGRWIAILGEKIVADGKSFEQTHKKVGIQTSRCDTSGSVRSQEK